MEGIKELLQIPLTIYPYEGQSDTLDVTYGAPKVTTCYGEGKMTVITDKFGKEVVSELTLYADGSDELTDNDKVEYYGKKYNIRALNAIRELDGTIALWLVYV